MIWMLVKGRIILSVVKKGLLLNNYICVLIFNFAFTWSSLPVVAITQKCKRFLFLESLFCWDSGSMRDKFAPSGFSFLATRGAVGAKRAGPKVFIFNCSLIVFCVSFHLRAASYMLNEAFRVKNWRISHDGWKQSFIVM